MILSKSKKLNRTVTKKEIVYKKDKAKSILSFIVFRHILRNLFYKIFKQKTRIKIENIIKNVNFQ